MVAKYKFKRILKHIIWAVFVLSSLLLLALHGMAIHSNTSDSQIKKLFANKGIEHSVNYSSFENKSLRYIKAGEAQDALIVFIHGAPGSWDAFEGYMMDSSLLSIAQLISIDRLGYGNSSPGKTEPSILKHAEALTKLAEKHPSQKLLLVGHSYGGPIAAAAANLLQEKRTVEVLMIAPLNDPQNEPVKWYAKLCDFKPIKFLLPKFIKVATEEKISHSSALTDILAIWNKIQFPITHYHGTKDQLAPFEANFKFSKSNIPSQHLELISEQGGNHLLIWNQYDRIKNLIMKRFKSKSF